MFKKRYFVSLAIASAVASTLCARDLKVSVINDNDLWWLAPEHPSFVLQVTDTLGNANNSTLRITVTTDDFKPLQEDEVKLNIAKGVPTTVNFDAPVGLPGFYRLSAFDGDRKVMEVNFGFEPENIVSLPDNMPDIRAFWDKAIAELAEVEPQYSVTELPEKSGNSRKMYLVKMQSLGGDTIRGYLMLPVKEGKYPAKIYYNGYGAQPWDMDPESNPELIEFQTYVRGQGLNAPYNKYGDWVVYNLEDIDNYYYRGAFMDVIRFMDFIYQLPQTDTRNIFTEGGSQGGALTLVSGALDHRVNAIAPYIPFLSDYPDYFRIVHWPGEVVKNAAKEKGMTDDEMYRNLSYFDIKNLARWINCPVLMGVGLQDPTCPPHTNFAGYNLINAPKEFVIYRDLGHTVDYSDWNPRVTEFYRKYTVK